MQFIRTSNIHRLPSLAALVSIGTASIALQTFGLTYEETVSGDLSNNPSAPTSLDFSLGLNSVSGTMGFVGGNTDADIFTFTVAPGQEITSLNVIAYTPSSSPGTGSFFAISAGTSISAAGGQTHLSNKLIAGPGEILPDLAATKRFTGGFTSSPGASSLTSPIGPGTYTVWFQEAGKTSVDYKLGFTVVPEPSTLAFFATGLSFLMFRRKRA